MSLKDMLPEEKKKWTSKPSTSDSKGTSSKEAYVTIVTIQRFRKTPQDIRGSLLEYLEEEYSFQIGMRTFPEVLTLVDDIKTCMGLMK